MKYHALVPDTRWEIELTCWKSKGWCMVYLTLTKCPMQGAAFLSEILKTCMKDAKSMAMALNSGLDMAYDNDETG